MKNYSLEIFLVSVNLLVWLRPAIKSLRRKTFSFLHPSIIVPMLVSISVLAAMTEHWFHWSGRGLTPGLRLTTRVNYYNENLFILPLFILLLAGIAFFIGVRLGCGRTVPDANDKVHIDKKLPFIPREYGSQLIPVSLLVSLACMMPYIIFGTGNGFFWAAALIYAFNFVPALVYSQNAFWGKVFLVLGLLVIPLRGNKGDFIYYFLPLLLFFQSSLFKGEKTRHIRRAVFLGMIGLVIVAGTIKMHQRVGDWDEGGAAAGESNLVQKLMVREYGFEVFSIMASKTSIWGNAFDISPYGSWFAQEMKEAVPSFVGAGKLNMGHEVAKNFLPYDFENLPKAGFYRFFLLSFYYDMGIIGAIGGAFLIGLVLSFLYRLALSRTLRLGAAWPLFIYLPVPVYSELIVNGAFPYALTHIMAGSIAVWLIARLTMLNLFGVKSAVSEPGMPGG